MTTYELIWPDGTRDEIVGREALLGIINDEKKLANVTVKSDIPIRHLMSMVKAALDEQAVVLAPIKPRVLFAALGQKHAEQIAAIATEHGIPTGTLYHKHSARQIRDTRQRFESESGDLQGIAQLRMLGQGYDLPPISVANEAVRYN